MSTIGGNDVEVKFGGSTTDLDNASSKAAADITKVGTSANNMNSIFGRLKQTVRDMGSAFKIGFSGGSQDAINRLPTMMHAASESMAKFGEASEGAFSAAQGGVMGLSSGLIGLGVGGLAVAGAFKAVSSVMEFGEQFGDEAEKLDQMAAKLGMAATEVSKWGNLATISGMSTEAFAASAQKLERTLYMAANGGKAQSAAFKALGIDIKNVTSTNQLMLQIADKMSTMEDGPKKTALAMQTMGRAGANMIPILSQGSKAIKEQFDMAELYGANVSEDFMKAGLAVDDANDQMTLASKGLKDMLFEELAPTIVVVAEGFNDMVKEMIASYREGGSVKIVLEALVGVFKTLVTIVQATVAAFKILWAAATSILSSIAKEVGAVATAMGKLAQGDFSGAAAAYMNGTADAAKRLKTGWNDAAAAGTNFYNSQKKLYGGTPSAGHTKPTEGPDHMDLSGEGGAGKKKNSGAAAAAAKRAAEKELRDYIEDNQYKQDLAKDDFAERMRLEDEKLSRLKAFYGEDSREYIKGLREKEAMTRAHLLELAQLEQERIKHTEQLETIGAESENELANIKLENAKRHFDAMDQLGLVNGRQRVAAMRQFADEETNLQVQHENDIYNIKDRSVREQLKLDNLPLETRRKLLTDLETMEVDHQARIAAIRANQIATSAKLEDDAVAASVAKTEKMLAPVESAFGGFLNSMLTRSASFKQAMITMLDGILTGFVQMGVKALFHWIAMEHAKTAATTTGEAIRTGVEAAGAKKSLLISAATAVKQIIHKAAVAAAGAYAAIASIPVVGPFLAPAAAAAALYGVYKLASSIFSAEGGDGEVQSDNAPYRLHKKEMVLPAKYANPLRDMLLSPRASSLASNASSAGSAAREGGQKGGDVNFNYQPAHEVRTASLEDMLHSDGRVLRRWIENEVRNGSLRLKSA